MSRVALAVLAMLATGCILTANSESEEKGFINAAWGFRDAAGGAPADCPEMFPITKVTAQPIEGGDPIFTLYPCNAFAGSAGYPLGEYDVTITIADSSGNDPFASSLAQRVDIVITDASVGEEFITDGGRVMFGWALVDATTTEALDCATAGSSDISIALTGVDPMVFPCADGGGITGPLAAGSYEASIAAVNLAGDQIGTPVVQTLEIGARNSYQDLGVVVLPVD